MKRRPVDEDEVFDLEAAIDRYSYHIANDIRSHRKRREVAKEYAAHLEDATYEKMLSGLSKQEAFSEACGELGEATKLQEMLACVHNRDPLPSYVRYLLLALGAGGLFALYFLIENTIFRAWLLLFFQLTAIGFGIYGTVCLVRLVRTVRRRLATLRKLRRFCEENGLTYICRRHGLAGMFRPTKAVEVAVETPDTRYVLSLWGTFHGKRHLHLTDIGLYMYTRIFGYANIWTRAYSFFPGGHIALALPKGLTYFSAFHTELTDVPKGTHLLPRIDWKSLEHPTKENVHILLLSPVPFKTSALISGRINEVLDGDTLVGEPYDGAAVYSTVGFISYLKGEGIISGGTFKKKK